MGYTTDFEGEFAITPALRPVHQAYLVAFSETRRMRRNAGLVARRGDPVREAVGLSLGDEAGYFVAGGGDFGQAEAEDIIDHNSPPSGQPGLWCKWAPLAEDGTTLGWDGMEKFYDYTEWLVYLIDHFLGPWGYRLDGTVTWQGENPDDSGEIRVEANAMTVVVA